MGLLNRCRVGAHLGRKGLDPVEQLGKECQVPAVLDAVADHLQAKTQIERGLEIRPTDTDQGSHLRLIRSVTSGGGVQTGQILDAGEEGGLVVVESLSGFPGPGHDAGVATVGLRVEDRLGELRLLPPEGNAALAPLGGRWAPRGDEVTDECLEAIDGIPGGRLALPNVVAAPQEPDEPWRNRFCVPVTGQRRNED